MILDVDFVLGTYVFFKNRHRYFINTEHVHKLNAGIYVHVVHYW